MFCERIDLNFTKIEGADESKQQNVHARRSTCVLLEVRIMSLRNKATQGGVWICFTGCMREGSERRRACP